MRKLTYFVAMSVDGFIAGPQGQFDFFPMEGEHLQAQAEELPETFPHHVREMLKIPTHQARFDTVVMGRGTYAPALSAGITHPYSPLETVVFSRSMPARQEGTLRITSEAPVGVIRELKARPGKGIWLCGGGQLATQLAGEIDELVVKVNPVLAVDGIRLFQGAYHPRKMKLRERREFSSGVCWLSYDLVPER